MTLFFKKLKEARDKAGKTQQEMAAQLGISWQQYQKYEGATDKAGLPPHKQLLKINEILNVDLSRFIYKQKDGKEEISLGGISQELQVNLVLLKEVYKELREHRSKVEEEPRKGKS